VDLAPALLSYSLCDTHLQPSDLAEDGAPVDGVPVLSPGRECTGVKRLSLLSPFPRRFHKFSRNERPVGRGLTFVPGDVETRIRPITGRPSLFPTSQARTSVSFPHGSPSLTGEDTGLPRSAPEVSAGLGTCCRPGSAVDHEVAPLNPPPASVPFGSSLSATLACSH
jgi:hypothetical protein